VPDQPKQSKKKPRAWFPDLDLQGILQRQQDLCMKITEALFAEHLVFHSMFDQIETRAPNLQTLGEVKALAALMEAMLKAHSDTEDELFLGPLEHCFEQIGQRDSFLEEHQEVSAGLRLVQKATRVGQAQRLLLTAVRHSRRHFEREERIVFPLAERVLKSATLSELGQNWVDQRIGTVV
jgi:hemerythrin-like domain-containing protein